MDEWRVVLSQPILSIYSYFFCCFHIIVRPNGTVEFLTKGDNNRVDDRGLYASGQMWLQKKDVLGRARGALRYVGMVVSD